VISVVNGFVRCLNTVSIQANASLFVIIFDAARHSLTTKSRQQHGYRPQKRVLQ
jgi:hypothetical protein